jgi:hypothetical protein
LRYELGLTPLGATPPKQTQHGGVDSWPGWSGPEDKTMPMGRLETPFKELQRQTVDDKLLSLLERTIDDATIAIHVAIFIAPNMALCDSTVGTLLSLLRFGLFRIWAAIPVLVVAGGALARFRKVLQLWMDNRSASVEWER